MSRSERKFRVHGVPDKVSYTTEVAELKGFVLTGREQVSVVTKDYRTQRMGSTSIRRVTTMGTDTTDTFLSYEAAQRILNDSIARPLSKFTRVFELN